jgi:hypothetical protein
MHNFDALVIGGGNRWASVPHINLSCDVGDGCSGPLLILRDDFVGRRDDGVHGIAVIVVTLG